MGHSTCVSPHTCIYIYTYIHAVLKKNTRISNDQMSFGKEGGRKVGDEPTIVSKVSISQEDVQGNTAVFFSLSPGLPT